MHGWGATRSCYWMPDICHWSCHKCWKVLLNMEPVADPRGLNMEQGWSLSDLTVTFMFSFCFYIVTAPQVE